MFIFPSPHLIENLYMSKEMNGTQRNSRNLEAVQELCIRERKREREREGLCINESAREKVCA